MDTDQILAITFITLLALSFVVCIVYISMASCKKQKEQDRLLEV